MLILLDIDNFKFINDIFGYVVGDEVIIVFVEELLLGLWVIDIVGCYGGDEFGVILFNIIVE